MSRGLGKIEKHVLMILKTKSVPREEKRAFLSTDEIICEISFDYKLWLRGLPPYESFFNNRPRSQERLRRFEPLRVSVHRALQSLEKKGLVVSYFQHHSKWWAIPGKIKDLDELITKQVQLNWVQYDKEERERRRESWKHSWRIRRIKRIISPELWIRYRFGLATEAEKTKIKELYESQVNQPKSNNLRKDSDQPQR